jgi:hypothetical protein
MFRRIIPVLLLVMLAPPGHATVKIPTGYGNEIELYANSYALLIGVSDYDNFPDLPGVKEDIAAVKTSLEQQAFKVITVMNPSRDELDNAIEDFIASHGQDINNRLLFYYAGHGFTLKTSRGRELGYILPKDTPLPENNKGQFKRTAVSMLEMEIYAKQMEAKHAMFMFDSCFSGSLFELSRAIPAAISEKTARPVRQFITAGSADQEVPDKSIFRRQFVQGLDGEADMNNDGFITGTELAQFLEDTVTNYSRRSQTPQYGKIRDPILDKGDFVFLSPIKAPVKVPASRQQAQSVDPLAVELAYWESIKDSDDASMYQVYLDEYPEGRFATLAKKLIDNANKQKTEQARLVKQRKEEEKRLAELRAAREEEYKKQQAELVRMREENVKRMQALRKEQEQLEQKRTEEEQRLQAVLEQKKAVAESGNQVASVHPVQEVASKTIVFAPRSEWIAGTNAHFVGTQKFSSSDEYSMAIARSMRDKATTILPGNFTTKLVVEGNNQDLHYDDGDHEVAKQVCKKNDADVLVMPLLENVGNAYRTLTYSIAFYNCNSNDYQIREFDISEKQGEAFPFETVMNNSFRILWRDNISSSLR